MRWLAVYLIRWAIIATFAYATLVGTLYVGQRWLIFPTYLVDADDAAFVPPGSEAVAIRTADGETLYGVWKTPAAGQATIIAFHGNGTSASLQAIRFSSEAWQSRGFGYLAVAFRGYPGSTGSPSENGILADAEAALAFATAKVNGTITPIFYGHSLGASAAIALSEDHRSAALVAEAPFLSMVDMVHRRLPFVPSILVLDPLRSDVRLPGSRADLILIRHGTKDTTIPITAGRTLAQTNPEARFEEVDGADHMSIIGAFDNALAASLDQRPGP